VPGYVDLGGRAVAASGPRDREVTRVAREGQEIGLVIHDKRLLAERGVLSETIAAARLAIENEQLQAELNAQEAEIRASRVRIVLDGDRARRLLERDLHDGAQQRLVALSMAMPILHRRAPSAASANAIDLAQVALRDALDELRDVAHGIYPASLSDEGLAAALENLVERSATKIAVRGLPWGRFPATVEEAAYFAVAEILEDLDENRGRAGITVDQLGDELRLTVRRPGPVPGFDRRILAISDRVSALDGTVAVERGGGDGAVELLVSIPCA
jgi:signal transduction histidine kinase